MSEKKKKPFNDAFGGLQRVKAQLQADAEQKEREQKAAQEAHKRPEELTRKDEDDNAFLRAMTGVRRLDDDGKGEVVRKPAIETMAVRAQEDDMDALVDLASAIDPQATLEPGEELAAGARGLDVRIVKRLAKGGFAVDAQLDLHGLRKVEAEKKVEQFIKQSRASKLRTLLLITGKGVHSDPAGPVLKDAVYDVLTRGPLVKHVLAISPAIPEHGGHGAYYVLLRRR
jgi:DNA-nicking Smr family endonuclease